MAKFSRVFCSVKCVKKDCLQRFTDRCQWFYSEPYQTSKMDLFMKIVNGLTVSKICEKGLIKKIS